MGSRSLYVAMALGVTAGLCGALSAQERVDYTRQIKPVLKARCGACHGVLKQESGLRLDTAALALKGGAGGPVIRPGNAAASSLLRRVTAPEHGGRMPPEGEPLKPEEIAALRAWIQEGAKAPAGEQAERDPRDHWSFRPVRKPLIPKVRNSAWVRNPIDAFLARRYEEKGLKPQPEAPRLVLIRRLYLDLIGLPPSTEELARLEADHAAGWYERLAGRLLDDPRHGERWARHWMDIWRYSDWWGLGEERRNSQDNIWHWRDWLVESVNRDTPYDEMVREMLAADELYPNDLQRLRATGFLARNYFSFNRNQWMDDTLEHVSKGFLGLTVNCAKCHDHKYDPIKQTDYYRLRAFFEPYQVRQDVVPGETDLARDGVPRVFDGQLDTPTYLFIRGQESSPDKANPLSPGVPAVLSFEPMQIQPVTLPVEAWQPERRPWVIEGHLDAARKGVSGAEAALEKARAGSDPGLARVAEAALQVAQAELSRVQRVAEAMRAAWARADAAGNDPALTTGEDSRRVAAVRAERELAAARARLACAEGEERLRKAPAGQKTAREKELVDARAALEKAEGQVAAAVGPEARYTPLIGARWSATRFLFSGKDDPPVPFSPRSSGRRTALARWITDRRNPLTARVAVNHLWTRHMGVSLVPTVFDFGRKGTAPTQPELLDWLAAEFMEKGWSMKHLQRLIVTSAAYRMSSSKRGGEVSQAKDPDNRYFWRREPVRLEAEAVRDSILSLAGTLDGAMGGPPILAPAQPASRRRSLYFFHSDTDRSLFLTTFDGAAVRECYRRDQSIVPQQALALTNSSLVLDAAGPIAERLSRSGTSAERLDDVAFIRRAFTVVLGISAGEAEVAAGKRALEMWRRQEASGVERARFIWVLLNHNDFVTLR